MSRTRNECVGALYNVTNDTLPFSHFHVVSFDYDLIVRILGLVHSMAATAVAAPAAEAEEAAAAARRGRGHATAAAGAEAAATARPPQRRP